MRRIAVCCLVGVALAGGCSRHDTAKTSAEGRAGLFSRPHPKLGLWRTSITTNLGPGFGMTGELCLDASNEDMAFSSDRRGFSKDCEPLKYRAADGGFGFSTVCHFGRRTVTTDGIATGDFQKAYRVDVTTHTEPAPPGFPAQMNTAIRAAWVGPCPAGTKPGMKLTGLGQG